MRLARAHTLRIGLRTLPRLLKGNIGTRNENKLDSCKVLDHVGVSDFLGEPFFRWFRREANRPWAFAGSAPLALGSLRVSNCSSRASAVSITLANRKGKATESALAVEAARFPGPKFRDLSQLAMARFEIEGTPVLVVKMALQVLYQCSSSGPSQGAERGRRRNRQILPGQERERGRERQRTPSLAVSEPRERGETKAARVKTKTKKSGRGPLAPGPRDPEARVNHQTRRTRLKDAICLATESRKPVAPRRCLSSSFASTIASRSLGLQPPARFPGRQAMGLASRSQGCDIDHARCRGSKTLQRHGASPPCQSSPVEAPTHVLILFKPVGRRCSQTP